MKRSHFAWPVCMGIALAATPALTDPQTAADFQWTFQGACLHSQPALIERGAESLAGNLGLDRLEASDVDAFWMGNNGLMIIVDGNPLATECVIALPQSEITDDAATLTRILSERITDRAGGAEVAQTTSENVTKWDWVKSEVTFTTEFEARDGSYTITLRASR